MSSDIRFVIEGACLLSVLLIAALSTPALGDRPLTRETWVRFGGILIAGLLLLDIFGGGSTIFAIVLGACAFVAGLVGLMLALTAGWRMVRRRGWNPLERMAATNFAGMGLWALMALTSLAFCVWCVIGWVQDSADQQQYGKAAACSTVGSTACRTYAEGTVVQRWAESEKGRHWVQVRVAGNVETIELETAYNVWDSLVAGQRVELTSWKGQVTELTAPGVGTMQTPDSPQFHGFLFAVFTGVSALAFIIFLGGAVYFGLLARTLVKGADLNSFAA